MELLNCPSPPHPFSLVMARIPESNYIKFDPLTLSKHFPNRNIHSLSHKRVIEHHAVVAAISEQLGHSNWHLKHENGGRPLLFINGEKSESKISISHMQCPEKASYAASVLANVDYNIGVDIVYTNDDRLNRISQRTMSESEIKDGKHAEVWAIKEAVFAFNKFPNTDVILGPEMKSTGEVMGIDESFEMAYLKSQIGAGQKLNNIKNIFISVRDEDKEEIFKITKLLTENNYNIFTTKGTHNFLAKKGVVSKLVNKVAEGSPHVVEYIKENKVDLVINTTENKQAIKDSFTIRRTSVDLNVPYYTNLRAAKILAKSLISLKNQSICVKPIQKHHIYN